MNQVANQGAGAVSRFASLRGAVSTTQAALPSTGDTPFLKLSRGGVWKYGAEDIENQEGAHWVIDPASIQTGFVCWTNYDPKLKQANKLLGEMLVPLGHPPVDFANLPDKGWPWNACGRIVLRCVKGDDEGVIVEYKPSSKGGMRAFDTFLNALVGQLDIAEAENHSAIAPVVKLEVDSYKHKQYGEIFTPLLNIVRFMDLADMGYSDAAIARLGQPGAAGAPRITDNAEGTDQTIEGEAEVKGARAPVEDEPEGEAEAPAEAKAPANTAAKKGGRAPVGAKKAAATGTGGKVRRRPPVSD